MDLNDTSNTSIDTIDTIDYDKIYTKEELLKMPHNVLRKLRERSKYLASKLNTQQMTKKILINSVYGAFTNIHFVLFNEQIAQAITGNGRYFIKLAANNVENFLQSKYKTEKPYILYGDTDSCVGDTVIETNCGKIKIEKLYDSINEKENEYKQGKFIKNVDNIKSLSLNTDFVLEYKTIKYIMKHTVNKRMFKIKSCDIKCNNHVIITEDHSIIVKRNNKLISVKPKDISSINDKLIVINNINSQYFESSDFEIKDLGIQENTVYDIEVEDNHNFFGNNILLHNSFYFHIEPFMKRIIEKYPNKNINDYVDKANEFELTYIQPVIQNTIKDFSELLNAYDTSAINMKRECIADKCVFVAKKKYIARVRDSEGVRYPADDPHVKVMGLELARSTTPTWCKEKLEESINYIFESNEETLQNWINELRSEVVNVDLSELCMYGSVSNINYNFDDKNIPWMSKASMYYNKYIKKNNLTNIYTEIKSGDKIKILFLNEPNKFGTDTIAYNSDNFINEFIDYLDYETIFTKGFLNPLNNIVKVLGYDIMSKTIKLDDW